MPLVVIIPESVVAPPLPVERFRIPVNVPSIAVVPLKLSTRLLPPPITPAANVALVPVSVVSTRSVTASEKVCVPVVVIAPESVVEPPLPVERFRIPVNVPSIAVVPLKLSTRLLPPPITPAATVELVPVSVVSARSVTASE